MKVGVTVNGAARTAEVEPRTSLLDFIRDTLGLTATHMGCEHGVCGACTVLLDGTPVRSCLIYAVQADGYAVTTAESLRAPDGTPGPLMDAFIEAHGLQCGYCTPGILVSAHALLQRTLHPSDEDIKEAIGGNLCRCTGYVQIVEAIKLAAERLRETSR